MLAGIVALLTGIVGLAFTVAPSLKPDPGNGIGATMKVLTVEPNATFRDFLSRLPPSRRPAKLDPGLAKTRGFVVYLSIQVDGRKRRDLDLQESIYLKRTGERTAPAQPASSFSADTPSDRWIVPLFVPDTGLGEPVFARYELFDHGVLLAMADTHALTFPE